MSRRAGYLLTITGMAALLLALAAGCQRGAPPKPAATGPAPSTAPAAGDKKATDAAAGDKKPGDVGAADKKAGETVTAAEKKPGAVGGTAVAPGAAGQPAKQGESPFPGKPPVTSWPAGAPPASGQGAAASQGGTAAQGAAGADATQVAAGTPPPGTAAGVPAVVLPPVGKSPFRSEPYLEGKGVQKPAGKQAGGTGAPKSGARGGRGRGGSRPVPMLPPYLNLDRLPPAPVVGGPAAGGPAAGGPTAPSAPALTLTGVIRSEDGQALVAVIVGDAKHYLVQKGWKVGDYTVAAISAQTVELRAAGRSPLVLHLGGGKRG